MLIKILSLSFDSAKEKFSDDILRDFIKDKEIISIRDYFFVRNEVPYLTLLIKYFPIRQEIIFESQQKNNTQNSRTNNSKEEAWKEILVEADMGLFNLLRDWRSERSKKEGVPPYVLFTNVQLAQIVKSRPQSFADLLKIDGIGRAKADKYGQDILKITLILENQTTFEVVGGGLHEKFQY